MFGALAPATPMSLPFVLPRDQNVLGVRACGMAVLFR
jgi:hypothetical protein